MAELHESFRLHNLVNLGLFTTLMTCTRPICIFVSRKELRRNIEAVTPTEESCSRSLGASRVAESLSKQFLKALSYKRE